MFDIGFWEIAIIGLIALLILGPERLPRAARTAGMWVGKARRTLAEVKRDIDRELDASELKELKDLKELKTIKEDLEESKTAIETDLTETKKVFEDAASEINEEIVDEYETVPVKADFKKPEPVAKEDEPAATETKATG